MKKGEERSCAVHQPDVDALLEVFEKLSADIKDAETASERVMFFPEIDKLAITMGDLLRRAVGATKNPFPPLLLFKDLLVLFSLKEYGDEEIALETELNRMVYHRISDMHGVLAEMLKPVDENGQQMIFTAEEITNLIATHDQRFVCTLLKKLLLMESLSLQEMVHETQQSWAKVVTSVTMLRHYSLIDVYVTEAAASTPYALRNFRYAITELGEVVAGRLQLDRKAKVIQLWQ